MVNTKYASKVCSSPKPSSLPLSPYLPTYLPSFPLSQRAWCLYEISCSSKLSVAISKTQRDAFYETLRNNQEAIMTALCNINLENATAWMKEDQERIFEVSMLLLLILLV